MKNIFFVVINGKDNTTTILRDSDAFQIFETLNTRGQTLNKSNLVKSLILSCLSRKKFKPGRESLSEPEFKKLTLKNTTKEEDFFEKKFFYLRGLYMEKNFDAWLALNPLTKFGETLVNRSNPDIYIVTTKNKEATKALLEYYRIGVGRIYANDEIKQAGSKGNLLSRVMDEASKQDAIFIDDAVQHLNTVADNRIKCFFANWGYGTNNGYPIYKWK